MNYDEIQKVKQTFELLEGKIFYFYGTNENKFKLDELVFEALEDPDDGYRSSLGAILVVDNQKIFHKRPLAKVIIESVDLNFYGHQLRDIETNHIWLEVGTDNIDDYYPCFVFKYSPDTTQSDYIQIDKDYKPFEDRYPELILKAPEWFNRKIKLSFEGY